MSSEQSAQLALGIYAVAAVVLVLRDVRRFEDGLAPWLMYFVQRLYIGMGFRWRANRRCPLPATGPAIIIANHRSPIDPLMMWMNHHLRSTEDDKDFRIIEFMVAREFCELPGFIGWICRNMRSIPTERDGRDMRPAKEALSRLKAGRMIGIFPEGRINKGTGLLEANPGVAWMALRSQVPVYPIFIHNAPQGRNMIEPFSNFRRVRVTYGDPIDLSEFYSERKSKDVLKHVTDLMMHRLAKLGGLADDDDDDSEPPILPMQRQTTAQHAGDKNAQASGKRQLPG